jgi:chloramphenicol 3-O phosphotransferase
METMKYGKVILINGASSSGKTSILHSLQDLLDEPFLEVGIDKFIWMMPGRYLDRPLWDDVLGLADKPGKTGEHLVLGMHRAIRSLSLSGWNVLADHVLVQMEWVWDCVELFSDLPAWLVGINCPLSVLEQRERARKNRTLGQAKLQVPVVHKNLVYDMELDTSINSTEECARKVIARLNEPPVALQKMRKDPF